MNKGSNVKYCPHCGHPTNKNTKFCQNCGYHFKDVSDTNFQPKSQVPTREKEVQLRHKSKQSHLSKRGKWITGILVIILLCCIGGGATIHHHNVVQQQATQRQAQQSSQNNQNSNQNNQNNQQQLPNGQQAKHVLSNYLGIMQKYTVPGESKSQVQNKHSTQTHTVIMTQGLAQFYEHGTHNSSFKQMLKWCTHLANTNTPTETAFTNFHLHHIAGHKFEENYKLYYTFTHQPKNGDGSDVTSKYQAVTWHATVKKIKENDNQYHWLIIKANSGKDVTTPSSNTMKQLGLLGQ